MRFLLIVAGRIYALFVVKSTSVPKLGAEGIKPILAMLGFWWRLLLHYIPEALPLSPKRNQVTLHPPCSMASPNHESPVWGNEWIGRINWIISPTCQTGRVQIPLQKGICWWFWWIDKNTHVVKRRCDLWVTWMILELMNILTSDGWIRFLQ